MFNIHKILKCKYNFTRILYSYKNDYMRNNNNMYYGYSYKNKYLRKEGFYE